MSHLDGATDQRIVRSGRERIDSRRWAQTFAGRDDLRRRIGIALTEPPPQILAISGLGGMGKSFLLHSLRPDVNQDIAMCPLAWVNFQAGETDTHVAPALWSLREQLRATGPVRTTRFDIAYAEWFRRSAGRLLDRQQLLSDDIVQILEGLGRLEDVPMLGYAARTANWVVGLGLRGMERVQANRVTEWFYARSEISDTTEFPAALRELSTGTLELLLPRAMAADIADAGTALAPDGEIAKGDRCVLVVDTYERLGDYQGRDRRGLVPTFVEDLCGELVRERARALVVISGRDPTYWGWELASGHWVPDPRSAWGIPAEATDPSRCRTPEFEAVRLEGFSLAEMDDYLVRRRGLGPELVELVQRITGGYVLAAAIAADLLAADASEREALAELSAPAHDPATVERALETRAGELLHRLLEQLERQARHDLEDLLHAAAVPRWFDVDLLCALTGADPALGADLLHYSFVIPSGLRQRSFSVHPVVRDLLARQSHGTPRQRELHLAAVAEHSRRADAAEDADDRFAAMVEARYHRAATEGISGLLALDDLFERALSDYALDRCRLILDAVADLPLEDDESLGLGALMRARLARTLSDHPLTLAEIADAEHLLGGRDNHLTLRILRESSTAHRLAGKHAEALDRLDHYDACQTVGESRFLQGLSARNRAQVYKDTDRVGKALEETARARWLLAEVGPEDQEKLQAMGVVSVESLLVSITRIEARLRYLRGDYNGAVEDCEGLLTLEKDGTQVSEYVQLLVGHVLRQEGSYAEAEEIARRAEERFARERETRGISTALILLGETLIAADRADDAADAFERLCRDGPSVNPYGPLYGKLGLAEVARLRGEQEIALGHYQAVVEGAFEIGCRMEIAFALLGRSLATCRGDRASARCDAEEALKIGRSCQAPWIELYAHLCVAVSETGDGDNALTAARECNERFARRPGDRNIEAINISRVEQALDGEREPDVRLSFL